MLGQLRVLVSTLALAGLLLAGSAAAEAGEPANIAVSSSWVPPLGIHELLDPVTYAVGFIIGIVKGGG